MQEFAADTTAMAVDPVAQEGWAVCMPMQVPFAPRRPGEWWSMLDDVFHHDR